MGLQSKNYYRLQCKRIKLILRLTICVHLQKKQWHRLTLTLGPVVALEPDAPCILSRVAVFVSLSACLCFVLLLLKRALHLHFNVQVISVTNHCQNLPRETLVCQHNPVQSLKVHLGRRLVTAAVFPSPSRFQLCAHFCSPQSFWVNKCKVLFPSNGSELLTSHDRFQLGKSLQHGRKWRNRSLQSNEWYRKNERETIQECRMKTPLKSDESFKKWIKAKMKAKQQREASSHSTSVRNNHQTCVHVTPEVFIITLPPSCL